MALRSERQVGFNDMQGWGSRFQAEATAYARSERREGAFSTNLREEAQMAEAQRVKTEKEVRATLRRKGSHVGVKQGEGKYKTVILKKGY